MSSSDWYASVFGAISSGIFIYSESGTLIDINPAGCKMHQRTREEMLSMAPADFIHPDSYWVFEEFMACIARGEEFRGDAQGLRKDGSVFDVEVYGAPVVLDGRRCHFSNLIDVTERNRLRQRLEQSQRMEAVGRLAGGVAHDFNNLLTAIIGNAELGRAAKNDARQVAETLGHVLLAAEKAREITAQLLAFGRKQPLVAEGVEIDAVIERMRPMLYHLIRQDIAVTYQLAAGTARILVDASQLDQIILNLVLNAQDAMPTGGHLTIATVTRELEASEATAMGLSPGEYVALIVSDTGIGMNQKTQARIFEPFFTTKGVGEGTGLGLATVYGIVKQHGGHVVVSSRPGAGSSFEVIFAPTKLERRMPRSQTLTIPRFYGERILVVDDDEQVRSIVSRWLTRAGCSVLRADGASEAARVSRQSDPPIDLLLTDVIMPGKNGRQLYQDLRIDHPSLRVVYMSGYTHEVLNLAPFIDHQLPFLAKPFGHQDLMRAVRDALDSPLASACSAATK